MIIIPVFIGLLGGVGAAGLKFLIHFFQDLFWGNQNYSGTWWLTILIPAAGAFVVGMIIYYFSSEKDYKWFTLLRKFSQVQLLLEISAFF